MVRLTSVIVSDDHSSRTELAAMLRLTAVPVRVIDRFPDQGFVPDLVIIDGRFNAAVAMDIVERVRAAASTGSIFVVAHDYAPDLVLHAMRAGATEFLTWPLNCNALDDAVRRVAARVQVTATVQPATTVAFFGAKGGVGTTTIAVNCAIELARLNTGATLMIDVKPGVGDVALFLGLRTRYTVVDALDNRHRLSGEFLGDLVMKHQSGLELLAGSTQGDRPGAGDSEALGEMFRMVAHCYEYVVLDVGNHIRPCALAALQAADCICLVINPDMPSLRNGQRLLTEIEQRGIARQRVRILLNRAAEPFPIPASQIENALGHPIDHTFPSAYQIVSSALNARMPLALTGNTDLAAQFDSFTRRILDSAGTERHSVRTANACEEPSCRTSRYLTEIDSAMNESPSSLL